MARFVDLVLPPCGKDRAARVDSRNDGEDGQPGGLPDVLLRLERPIDVFQSAGAHHADDEGKGQGNPEEFEALLIDRGNGSARRIDDPDHVHLTRFANPGSPELFLNEAGEAAVRVNVRREFPVLELVLGQPGKVLAKAGDLIAEGGFLPAERDDRGVESRHHLGEGLAILRRHRAARKIGGGGILHSVTQLALHFGNLLAEKAHAGMLVCESCPGVGQLGLEGSQFRPKALGLQSRGRRGRLGSGHCIELGAKRREPRLTHALVGLHFGDGRLELVEPGGDIGHAIRKPDAALHQGELLKRLLARLEGLTNMRTLLGQVFSGALRIVDIEGPGPREQDFDVGVGDVQGHPRVRRFGADLDKTGSARSIESHARRPQLIEGTALRALDDGRQPA